MTIFSRTFLLLLSICICFAQLTHAQSVVDTTNSTFKKDTLSTKDPDNSADRDMIDIIHHFSNKHQHTHAYTPTSKPGHNHWAVVPAAGYTLQTGFAGIISADMGFYTHNNPNAKLSNLLTSFTYSEYNQIILPIQADIWTKDNKYNIIIDWRYLKYPSETFGLGGRSDVNDGYTIDFSYIKLHQSILRSISKNVYAGIGYYLDNYWNVKEIDPPSGVKTSFQRYAQPGKVTDKEVGSGVAFKFLIDSRDNQINSHKGFFTNLAYRTNFNWLGSSSNWQSILIELRKYIPLPAHSKNVLALWSYNQITVAGKPAYLLLPSTGWDDFYNTGRGYVQGRYRGRRFIYDEVEYRFRISQNGLLGGVAFANIESVNKEGFRYKRDVAPGFGGGIRIKINKHSGANLCIDYGFGLDGSRGFFVNLGEVF